MKHPLTSKERRGLVAVAAAALLCIASGFVFRNCTDHPASEAAPLSEHSEYSDSSANSEHSAKSERSKRSATKKKKKKAKKSYPARDPLSQPVSE